VPLKIDFLATTGQNKEKLAEIFRRFEFNSLLERIGAPENKTSENESSPTLSLDIKILSANSMSNLETGIGSG